MSNKKKGNEDMQVSLTPTRTDRKIKIISTFDKAVKTHGDVSPFAFGDCIN